MSQMLDARPVSTTVLKREIHPSDDIAMIRSHIMKIMDEVATHVACMHAEGECITKGIDSIQFFESIEKGDLLICQATINRTWKTSLEVGVKIRAEGFRNLEEKDILSAYFTFIALDHEKLPKEIVPVFAESEEEKRRFREAEIRRLQRTIRRRSSHISLLNKKDTPFQKEPCL